MIVLTTFGLINYKKKNPFSLRSGSFFFFETSIQENKTCKLAKLQSSNFATSQLRKFSFFAPNTHSHCVPTSSDLQATFKRENMHFQQPLTVVICRFNTPMPNQFTHYFNSLKYRLNLLKKNIVKCLVVRQKCCNFVALLSKM